MCKNVAWSVLRLPILKGSVRRWWRRQNQPKQFGAPIDVMCRFEHGGNGQTREGGHGIVADASFEAGLSTPLESTAVTR
jgi:hypothetical protein